MGHRRMFSLKVINTARFLKLPIDAQNLYFHLGLRADDDGVVEAFPVMRLIGSSEDNLKLLHMKEFVKVLNDELITYIVDWKEHNSIRSDRKIDSIYKELLVQILPDVKLLESKERADRKGCKEIKNGTSQGQPRDGISKDKLSKDKLSKDNKIIYAEFVSMTEEEHQKLIEKLGEDKTRKAIETLDNYKGSTGRKYKDDYRAILSWVIDRVEQDSKKAIPQQATQEQLERRKNIKL